MKVMILGATGVVGTHLKLELEETYQVIGVARNSRNMSENADVTDKEEVSKLMQKYNPEVVVNAIKPSISTDEMEKRKEETWNSNVGVLKNILETTGRNTRIVQISTDWVYPGEKGIVYTENDKVLAKNYYTQTKIEAENLLNSHENSIILRTEGVFGIDSRGTNIYLRIRNAGEKELRFPTEQISQPIYSGELARAVKKMIEKNVRGTYNLTGEEYISRYTFAKRICDWFGFDTKIAQDDAPRKMSIPKYLRVNNQKAVEVIGEIKSLDEQFLELRKIDKD